VAAEPATLKPTIAVFASDQGPGDPERASIMSQVGAILARRGVRIICLCVADGSNLPVPLITSARSSGGEVLLVAGSGIVVPPALKTMAIETIDSADDRIARVAKLADAFVGLPGSLASMAGLYRSWVAAGAGPGGKPVVLLNRNRAFEVVRGMSADVLSHSVKQFDRMVVFTDNVDDLWNKVAWALGHPVTE
jgi:predicted Rossmann-fold nucleotide-binding protein